MVGSTFSTSKWAIVCLVLGGPERLPGWFVHPLANFGNVKKQMKNEKNGLKKVHHGVRLTEGGGGLVESHLHNTHMETTHFE